MKWSLVLSGGGARGLSYIGFLQAMEDMGYPQPSLITGCSIGAMIGGFYASGMPPARMKNFMLEQFDFKQFMTSVSFTLPENKLTKVLQVGEGLTHLLRRRGIESGEKVLDFIKQMTGDITFDRTRIPFICNATDLISGKEHVFKSGSIAEAIRASVAFPGMLEPIAIGDALYVDGYVTHNTPIWAARAEGIQNVLAVYIDKFRTAKMENITNGIDILMRSIDIAAVGKVVRPEDIATASLILPDSHTSYDFGHIEERIQKGYDLTKENRPMLDSFFEQKPLVGYMKRRYLYKMERLSFEQPYTHKDAS